MLGLPAVVLQVTTRFPSLMLAMTPLLASPVAAVATPIAVLNWDQQRRACQRFRHDLGRC